MGLCVFVVICGGGRVLLGFGLCGGFYCVCYPNVAVGLGKLCCVMLEKVSVLVVCVMEQGSVEHSFIE